MQLYGFTARDCDRLHALLAAYEQGRIRVDAPSGFRPAAHQQDSFLGSTSGTITAGHTGTATMVDLDTAIPPGQTLLSSVPTLPVFNPFLSDLPAGTYLFVLEPSQGYYIPSTPVSSGYGSFLYGGSGLAVGTTKTVAGAGIGLPGAGTYFVFATVDGLLIPTVAGNSGRLYCQLYDSTNAVAVGGTFEVVGVVNSASTEGKVGAVTIMHPYTVTTSVTVTVQGWHDVGFSGTLFDNSPVVNSFGMWYIKVA